MTLTVAIAAALLASSGGQPAKVADPFATLAVYDGEWVVRAKHPWSGAPAGAVDRLISRCHRFTVYFACEQTINGKAGSIIVYTLGDDDGHFNTRTIAPNGLAGGRGDLHMSGLRWSYTDKPPPPLKGHWSRVENVLVDHDHIRFREFESSDKGRSWKPVNSGEEVRL